MSSRRSPGSAAASPGSAAASLGFGSAFLRYAAASLGLLALLDVALSLTLIRDGHFGKRPLPPFGALTEPDQLEALERLERGEPSPVAVTGFDRELGWSVVPNAVHASGEFHINADGLRGTRRYERARPSGVLRLACFGDSFTFGDEVKDDWTYEALLEESDATIEALNFGVPAYGTDQALLRFRREGAWGAQVVVLGLLLENIGRNVNRYRTLWYPRSRAPLVKPRFALDARGELELVPQPFESAKAMARSVRDGSVLESLAEHEYWLGRPAIATGKWSSIGRLVGGFLAYRERSPERLWCDVDGEPRRVTLALVDAFAREARARGAQHFVVLVLPMKEELDEYLRSGKEYWRGLLDELARRKLDSLDLAPKLAEAQHECEKDPAHPTLYVATHLSSIGNAVIAAELRAWCTAHAISAASR